MNQANRIASQMLVPLLIFISSLQAQTPDRVVTGKLGGASYKIIFPAGWKNKLVMYAHGYEFAGTPQGQSEDPSFEQNMAPFLSRGFAVAASDYSMKGLAFIQGVDETEALRAHFVRTYGKPDTTFMVGHSMGGGITVATLENFGQYYNGGLPLCPLSSRPYLQVRKEFDIYATFNALFPGVVSKLSEIFDVSKTHAIPSFQDMMPRAMAIRKAIVEKDSALGVAFAHQFYLKFDDLPFTLFFDGAVLADIANKAHGNPFDNTNTLYSGFPDNWAVNEQVERLAATVDPNTIFGKYDRTGELNKPTVLMHTLYDQLIPPVWGEVNLENMVHQKGKDQWLVVKYTNGQGHCAFTPQQTAQAFDELRAWANTGKRAKPGGVK